MYRKIDDFYQDWNFERESTLKILKNLTDQSLNQAVTGEGRTLGDIAWHLVLTLAAMTQNTGLTFDTPPQGSPVPNAQQITEAYRNTTQSLEDEVKKSWTEDSLLEKFDMFGQETAKGKLLWYIILHQAHHRGQLTVLMRQAGLRVPGVYGPAKEEWEAMGIPAMK